MPTFMLGKNNRVLHSVSCCLLVFLLLFFLSPFSNAENLYNDKGNDSCLTIYSNDSVYRPNDLSRPKTIDVLLTIVNNCGLPITANLGLVTETKHTGLVNITSIDVTKGTKVGAITNKLTTNVLPFTSTTKNFETKTGWESIVLQDGNTEIILTMTIPLEDGEFAITIFNPLNLSQQSTLDPFYSGSGTLASPYQIRTCAQLQDMNGYTNQTTVYFELGSDIDCSDTLNWLKAGGGIRGFEPIGNENTRFKGNFDGNNFTIKNLMVYADVNVDAGLFGQLGLPARIKNVGLIDFNIYVTATTSYAGTLFGHANAGITDVNNVWVLNGKVTGGEYVGGLGGLSGADLNQVFVKNTLVMSHTGSITTGGLIGKQLSGDGGSTWHAYATAKISSIGVNPGGMAGGGSTGNFTESYWNVTDSNESNNSIGTVITQAQQKQQASYVNWDFTNIWAIAEDGNTPYFRAFDYVFAGPTIPDLNFVSIEGDLFVPPVKTYAYILDGNLSIDFNVSVSDNNRLTLDLNYGNTPHTIVKDLNLTSAVCPDQDWADAPSLCHLDFNIHSSLVSDGNYFLKAYLRTSDAYSTTVSDQNFLIANDMNIVIKVPIDEETGQPIDTTTLYRWTVRIYDSSGLQYYPDQKDQNGFVVPLGETITIIIDTNESTVYYPRQYSLIFTEATATYELQPYLIKQVVSGNFIFNVTNLTTSAPISGVQIKIYGFVPSLNEPNLQTITTDAAGLATIPLRLNSPYTVKFYYLDSLVHTVSITPTTSSLYYQVQLNIAGTTTAPEPADYGGITTTFYPSTYWLKQKSNGSIDINVSLSMITKTFSIMRIRVLDTNGCLFDNNVFEGPWTDANSVRFPSIDLNSGSTTNIHTGQDCNFDDQFSIFVLVDVNSTDGNQFQAHSINWQLVTENNYKYNLLYLLPNLATSINGGQGKMATTFLAFLVLITAISAVGAVTGGEPIMAAMLTLGILGFFVLIGFVDFLPFAFICIATFFGILYMWGRFG